MEKSLFEMALYILLACTGLWALAHVKSGIKEEDQRAFSFDIKEDLENSFADEPEI